MTHWTLRISSHTCKYDNSNDFKHTCSQFSKLHITKFHSSLRSDATPSINQDSSYISTQHLASLPSNSINQSTHSIKITALCYLPTPRFARISASNTHQMQLLTFLALRDTSLYTCKTFCVQPSSSIAFCLSTRQRHQYTINNHHKSVTCLVIRLP